MHRPTETVIGFLKAHNLDKDFKVNIEVNHATLAGHTFEHELAVAVDTRLRHLAEVELGVVGSMTIHVERRMMLSP